MPKISKVYLGDVISKLEDIGPLEIDRLPHDGPEDVFLCALGFEPRCLTLPSRLHEAGYKAKRAYFFKYATNLDDNATNLHLLEGHLSGIAPSVESVEVDTSDFPKRLRNLLDSVVSEASQQPPRITLDISVTANRLLLRCIKILLEYDVCLRIVYSEAEVYYPSEAQYQQDPKRWEAHDSLGLERGVGDVTVSIEHPGNALDPLPDSLFLIPSLKADRSKAVISHVDPSLLQNPGEKVIWLLGVPHLPQDRWRVDAMKRANGISQETRQFNVSTFDYKETLRRLESLHDQLADANALTLSPLGSKMQALGATLFCYMHPDVRVIFSSPKEYNAAQYSKGCKDMWMVNFGVLNAVREKLDQVGTLRIDGWGEG